MLVCSADSRDFGGKLCPWGRGRTERGGRLDPRRQRPRLNVLAEFRLVPAWLPGWFFASRGSLMMPRPAQGLASASVPLNFSRRCHLKLRLGCTRGDLSGATWGQCWVSAGALRVLGASRRVCFLGGRAGLA